MRILKYLVVILAFTAVNSYAQPSKKKIVLEAEGQPFLKFETTSHDFGKIKEGTKATYEFKFTNTGKTALILTDVVPPCSCTVPEWPKEPIMPGKTAIITVTFDSKGKPGNFNKTIEVKHNGEAGRDYITIKGVVGT